MEWRRAAWTVAAMVVAVLGVGCGDEGDAPRTPVEGRGSPASAPAPDSSPGTTVATTDGLPSTTAAPASTLAPTSTATPTSTVAPDPGPGTPVAPLGPGDRRVYVLGDSVLLGASAELTDALAGWEVGIDAAENRLVTQAAGILRDRQAAFDALVALYRAEHDGADPPVTNAFGRVVVVHLCTSFWAGGGFGGYVDQIMGLLAGVERVVWVTCTPWDAGPIEANQAIEDAGDRYPNIVVADWAALSATPGYTYGDGIHLAGPGRGAFAGLVAAAVGPAPGP